jgi:Uma2 family endonuclease
LETAVGALAVEPGAPQGQGWDDLVRIWEETETPAGCSVEIVEGIVTVAPPRSNGHQRTAELLQHHLHAVTPPDWGVYRTLLLAIRSPAGLYLPDLVVLPRESVAGPGNRVAAEEARLVVEITSRDNANHDRIAKAHGYAQAGVPLYLLLDPWHSGRPTATLYGVPEAGTYRVLDSVEYGEKLTLPAPFGLDIDTAEFPAS